MTRMRKSMVTSTHAAQLLGAGLAALLGAGCLAQHEAPSVSDTATNWLRSCARNSDCAGANACLQNVCTLACRPQQGNTCRSLHTEASCEANATNAGVCDLACTDNAQCAALHAGFMCLNGRCRDSAAGDNADPGVHSMDASGAIEKGGGPVVDAGVDMDAWARWLLPADAFAYGEPGDRDAEAGTQTGIYWEEPGCTARWTWIGGFQTGEELEPYLLGRWAPCRNHPMSASFGDTDAGAGLEFTSDGAVYGLSMVNGTYVRNGVRKAWRFSPPPFALDIDGHSKVEAYFTPRPRSLAIGIDPTMPRFVPLR